MASPLARRRGPGGRRTPDIGRWGKALAQPGIDTRHWVSYGTVCTVDDQGNCRFGDKGAVYVGPEGVEVDVLLEPLGIPCTCHYYGVQGGCEATVLTPIRPGDRVLVVMPEGDTMGPPVIVAVLHSASCKVPLGEDRLPVWRNDRVMIWSQNTDIDVRTRSGTRLQVKQDGTILLGDGATEQLVKGTSYRAAERAFLDALNTYIAAIKPIADPGNVATPAMLAAIETFRLADNLSDVSKTK